MREKLIKLRESMFEDENDEYLPPQPLMKIEKSREDKYFNHVPEIMDKKKELQKVYNTLNDIVKLNRAIKAQNNRNYWKNEQYIQNIKNIHEKTRSYLLSIKLKIWKSPFGSIYYNLTSFGKKIKISTDDDFYSLVNENIHLYDTIDKVQMYDDSLFLVKSLLPTYEDDIFYPLVESEVVMLNNQMYCNTFQYSDFLYKNVYKDELYNINRRNKQRIIFLEKKLEINNDSFIIEFLNLIFHSEMESNYFIDWLAYFFQTMKKTDTALVIIGDSEVSDILINQIIRPIFAYKKEYFASINDDTLKKTNEIIIKDKIFYHIGELSEENITNKKTSRLVMDILKENRYYFEETIETNETYIWGQLIVTAEKDTPYPLLKDSYSRCSVFSIKHMNTILRKLDIDRITLESMIQDDLNNFLNRLVQENLEDYDLTVMDTCEKDALPTMKNGILMTPQLNQNIEIFIKNIQEKNLLYFQNIKNENSDLYEELEYNFKENMIAQPLLNNYFNLVYGDIIFLENNHLLEILKEKSPIFTKAPDDKSKYNAKKRYTIK